MGSTAFKEWAATDGHIKVSPLSQFKGMRIAIDAEDYLNTILCTSPMQEPLLLALGGLPFALEDHVRNHLEVLREAEVEPIFVFNGLDLACKDRRTVAKESTRASRSLEEAWALYNQGSPQEAVEEFGKSCTYRSYHILRWLEGFLNSKGARVLVAPYCAAAQQVQLEKDGLAEVLAGSASLLVFGYDQVVIGFDWVDGQCRWISNEDMRTKLHVSQSQLIDVCLLAGSSLLSPLIEIEEAPLPPVQTALNQLRGVNFDANALCMRSKDDDYLQLWRKCRAAIKHCPVITKGGKVEVLNPSSMPGDGHEFLGQQLPPELIAYMSTGIVGPRLLNWRARSEIFETAPLDGGLSQAYRDLILEKLVPLRAQSLGILTKTLHRYYQRKDVELICWFNDGQKRGLGVPDLTENATKEVDTWKCDDEEVLSGFNSSSSPIRTILAILAQDGSAKKSTVPSTQPLQTSKQLAFNTLARFLQHRGYIKAAEHTLTASGKALQSALDAADAEMEDAVFMAFELLSTGDLNETDMFPAPPYFGAPARGSTADKHRTSLVSRVACLLRLDHRSIGYTGPLSRHLLAYQQLTAIMRGALRDLLEAHACHLLCSGSAQRKFGLAEYSDFAFSIPLLREPDLGLGLAVKSYLDELSQEPVRRSNIALWFQQVPDFDGNLQKAWKLWAAINTGVQAADASVFKGGTKKLFKETDEWLHQKLSTVEPAAVAA